MAIIKQAKMKKAKIIILTASMALLNTSASGALPPEFQNLNDMNVMVNFAKQHRQIMMGLKTIDVAKRHIVFVGYSKKDKAYKDCVVQFTRKSRGINPPPGPAGKLIFKESSCAFSIKKQ